MAFFRSAIPSLLVLAACLQLSVCLLKEIKGLRDDGSDVRLEKHVPVEDIWKKLPLISKRATGDHDPVLTGDHTFDDGYPTAMIHYSGGDSTVIFVLTYVRSNGVTTRSNLYRSDDYGVNFVNINSRLSDGTVVLSPAFFTSDFNEKFLLFAHATQSLLYYTVDEGDTFHTIDMSSENINPRSIRYHPSQDGWMMAVDSSVALHVTQDFGRTWTKVDDNIASYQWADQKWDTNTLMIYYTTNNPDQTVNLFTSAPPFTTHQEFDPGFGPHDAFLLHGPYVFAQRTDNGKVNLYVSHMRKPFKLARIPTPYNHQNYLVNNIDELLALVVIEHEGGFYNLYLSDTTGMDYTLSLRDLVVERGNSGGYQLDLEIIDGVNGTLIANQYVRDDPSQQNAPIRTLISLDNGGIWELILPPDYDVNGRALNCEPPSCSLHLHMDTTNYARLGVFSTDSAPGLIVAHGSANRTLLDNPDLYISRDGGITWEETLAGSWGVNVADHGGLLVAARDYHQEQSRELMYSCNEGYSWLSFEFSTIPATIYGVITEPGQHTTFMSLYGVLRGQTQWRVFTVNFQTIFNRLCVDGDYVQWMPWDLRSDTDCILGSTVTIERRRAQTCCLNGRDYIREISVAICDCNGEDFECDYGYERESLTGPCVRDADVVLPDPCANGKPNYTASSGYRKIAGDVCQRGVEYIYAPFTAPCCGNSTLPPTLPPVTKPTDDSGNHPNTSPTSSPSSGPNTGGQTKSGSSTKSGPLIGTGVVIAILGSACGVILVAFAIVALKYSSLRKRHLRLITAGEGTTRRIAFHSDRDSSLEPLTRGEDSALDTEDDAPLIP